MTLTCVFAIIAKADGTRTPAEIMSMAAKYPQVNRLLHNNYGLSEASLKVADHEELNTIEKELLEKYDDVVIHSFYANWYFVFDSEGKIGLCDLNGIELVPPIEGHFGFILNFFTLGQFEDPQSQEFINGTVHSIRTSTMVDKVVSFGSFQTIINKETMEPIIPYGKYHDIRAFYNIGKATSRKRNKVADDVSSGQALWYFVGRLNDEGTMLWGLCDDKGEEIIPVKYLGIRKVKGKFVGTYDMTLEECEDESSLTLVHKEARYEEFIRRLRRLTEIGERLDQMLTEADNRAQNMMSFIEGGYGDKITESMTAGNDSSRKNLPAHVIQSRYDSAIDNIRDIMNSWPEHVGTHGEVVNMKNLDQVKSNIQRIKALAQRNGVTLRTNPLENWSPR